MLAPESLLVRQGDRVVMHLWFRTLLPVSAPAGKDEAAPAYRRIPEGAIVGAVRLPEPFIDYRRQRLPAGLYLLRFAIQPDTGDHTDTAPHREFLLLTRATDDTTPGPMETGALIEMSSRVTGGRHPALLLLWPVDEGTRAPAVIETTPGVLSAAVDRPASDGVRTQMLRFGITVAGSWMQ